LGAATYFLGFDWKTSLTTGLILAMSSTAIVLQSLNERGLLKTNAGQSSFSVLLFQDIAIIPILAFLPLIATQQASDDHGASIIAALPAWAQALAVLGAVAAIVLAGRYLMRPLFRFVAQTGIREVFVAFALLIVVGITLLMQFVGLSAALGTFLAGVVLAESEYRHELEMDLNPFKGLLLAVFFIAVGAGINFGLLLAQPVTLIAGVIGFIIAKLVLLYVLARGFRMSNADSSRFSFSLAQGGEFAFVLISFAFGLGLLSGDLSGMLVAIVAISMALAPLLMLADDELIQPRFNLQQEERETDIIDETDPAVIIAGYGRFGMTIGRLLTANGVRTVVLDHDAEQIDSLRKFGFKVFYGDATRTDLLEAAGIQSAKAIVIAIDDREKALELAETVRKHFPGTRIFARAFDRYNAYQLINLGIKDVYREVFDTSITLGEDILAALGRHPFEAHRSARIFAKHDRELMFKAAKHIDNDEALIDIARAGRAHISSVLSSDRVSPPTEIDSGWEPPDRTQA
jgi:Kef-type K+ transport system membrane component KefB